MTMSYYSEFAKLEKMKQRLEKDQRKSARNVVNLKVESSKLEKEALVANLTMFGAFISTKRILPVGEWVDLKFIIDERQPVEFKSQVVRQEIKPGETGIGVEFKEFNQVNFDELLTWVLSEETREI
jgi:hypothetical protein